VRFFFLELLSYRFSCMYFYNMKLKHGSSAHIDPIALLLKTAKRFFRAFLWQST
jgi:hypothetical protein